ncbi:MBL fold metallo-hydrolase [Aequorivita echinoideorum]|uniref:MBL fold metallo-hydrolase n=1 Tax=Aequorivita echinoideorum TaxID=1549647 RepID=A0ABS5S4R1_9FLAO|nr:MBL fold metallo-hydrolase [Aequorivita echinoideorum]MBT0608209.1 MBL fold metallo-hydrolase [Aequorivita echinoideorum]
MKRIYFILAISMTLFSCKDNAKADENSEAITEPPQQEIDGGEAADDIGFAINPVQHASMVLQWDDAIIYVDPVGGKELFSQYTAPSLILVTDIHQDHMDATTLAAIMTDSTKLITPQAVADKLPQDLKSKAIVMNNGATKNELGISIEAMPMYNLREEAKKFHEKGRGNGYVLEKDGKRIYISGDTEDIPEMRNLKNIDIAFVCMNLPYTMPVEKAAEGVLAFRPKTVYPYHYRGTDGLSDVDKFKNLVEAGNPDIKVTQLDWYPKQ